jgi:hypothetical protein
MARMAGCLQYAKDEKKDEKHTAGDLCSSYDGGYGIDVAQ